jgi:hypothetical protein
VLLSPIYYYSWDGLGVLGRNRERSESEMVKSLRQLKRTVVKPMFPAFLRSFEPNSIVSGAVLVSMFESSEIGRI